MDSRVGFWPRAAAYTIDFVILSVLAWLARGLATSLFPGAIAQFLAERAATPGGAAARGFLEGAAGWSVALSLVSPFYLLIEGLTGWSPGKLLLGLRVVADSGQSAPLKRLMLRYAVKGSAALISLVGVLTGLRALGTVGQAIGWVIVAGSLLVLTTSRQALHDKAAGTAVLRKSDVGVSESPLSSTPATSS